MVPRETGWACLFVRGLSGSGYHQILVVNVPFVPELKKAD